MRTLAALLFATTMVFAQTCSVDGSVVNSVTGAAIPRAQVTVSGADDNVLAESDGAGKWSAGHVQCGRTSILVNRIGFLRFIQSNLALTADTPMHGVTLKLTPQAVLAGRVLDDRGDPILGAQVSLMTSRVIGGLRGIQASNSTATNDLGEYRFAGLAAGKYIICANAGGGAVVANGSKPYGEKCYPGPIDTGVASGVAALDVAAGYEGRYDFALPPIATVRVSGVVSGQTPGIRGSVSLTPRTQIARMSMGLTAAVRPDGTFVIANVPPGSYTAVATFGIGSPAMARAPVEVGNAGVEGLQLRIEPGFTVTGTVRVLSATARKLDTSQRYAVLLRSTEPGGPGAPVEWNDALTQFTLTDVHSGNYRLDFVLPPPFYLKSATLGGRDMVGSDVMLGPGAGNIEVVVSDDGGTVEGEVSNDDGPVTAWVYLERDGMPSRNARADARGHFKIDTLPPGDYKVYAWDDNSKVEYANPDWMVHNGKGVGVTVDPGQTAQVKLTRQTAPPE